MYTTTVGCFPALSRHVSLTRSVVWSYPIKAGSHVIALIVSVTAVASKSGIVIGRLYENNAQTIVNSGSVWGGRDRLDRPCCIRGISGFQCHAIQNRSKQKSKPFRIWRKKEGRYAKLLTKIQVTAIFLEQDMQRKDFTQIYRDLYKLVSRVSHLTAPWWR